MTRNTKLAAIGITLASLAIGPAGCTGPTKATKSTEQAEGSSVLSGKVTETMDAGGYTYILLEKAGKKTWVAIPVAKIAVGENIKLMGGAEMPGFTSKALNRTFDMIIFSGGLDRGTPPAEASAKTGTAGTSEKAILAGKVVETMEATSYTYILLEKDGKRGWAAVPTTDVKVGEEIELIPGVDMGSFKSTTLNRTFDSIHFSAGVKGGREKKAAALPPGHPKTDPAAKTAPAPAAVAESITGKVVETTDAGGYTYICLEKDNVKTWAAVPATKVSVGQEVTLAPGNVMHNFESKSLKRTFEKIIFTQKQDAK